jgi:hypothetical protein
VSTPPWRSGPLLGCQAAWTNREAPAGVRQTASKPKPWTCVTEPRQSIPQFTSLGFGPTAAGYGSVFVGWTGLVALAALATMLWLETALAQSLRGSPDVPYLRAFVEAVSFCWAVLALVEIAAFVLLYLVA